MSGSIVSAIQNHGVLAVFILMTLESCGVPLPSEVTMPVAGALAAGALGDHSDLSIWNATLTGALANLAGSLAAYWLARRFSEPVLLGPGRWIGLTPEHVALADRWFARRGLAAVFIGRLLPVVRTYISFPAGMARVEPVRFSVLTFAGALPWCLGLTVAGYEVGAGYDRVSGPVEKASLVVAVLVVLALAAWLVRGRGRAGGSAARLGDGSGTARRGRW